MQQYSGNTSLKCILKIENLEIFVVHTGIFGCYEFFSPSQRVFEGHYCQVYLIQYNKSCIIKHINQNIESGKILNNYNVNKILISDQEFRFSTFLIFKYKQFAKSLYKNMKIKNHNQINNGKKQSSTTDSPAQKYSKIGVRNQNNNKPKIAQHQDKQNIPYFSNKKTDQLIEKKQTENIKSLKNSRINEEVNALDQYQKQIIKYIKSTQYKYQISNNYLRNMDNITHQHRATFVKHFFKVAKKFQLKRNTIYLAVYYMDAYFAKNPHIQKKQAIITAQACLFIATKYQQIYPPDLYEWTHATKQIVLAESLILKDLDFTLTYTTTQNYLEYYFKKLDLPQKDKEMIRLISDVSLFDQSMYIYGSAELAVSILYSIVNRSKLEEKVQMSLKWMIQRNEKYMEWLQTMQACKSKHI